MGRDAVLAFQADHPEPWSELTVLRVVGDGDTAVAETGIVSPAETYRCAAFRQPRDGRLQRGVEYRVTVGGDAAPPRATGAA